MTTSIYDHTGQCLNFASMFILVLMLRHSITKLRQLGLPFNVILDRHIYFHKITGRLILIYSLLHTAMHVGNIGEHWMDAVGGFPYV